MSFSPYTEPIFLRDDVTGQLVLDNYGNPIVIGEVPVRPAMAYGSWSYLPTPAMSVPPVLTPPTMVRQEYYPGYTSRPVYGSGGGCRDCCVGCGTGLGCCLACDFCCDDCNDRCRGCCYW